MRVNPFAVKSPDQLRPEDVATFFVDTFTDFAKVASAENTFIHGARGTGKSMMLRGLDAPVQLKMREGARLRTLSHTGIHVPLKARGFRIPELTMAGGSANVALGEHLLTMVIATHAMKTFESVADHVEQADACSLTSAFESLYRECGGTIVKPAVSFDASSCHHFARMRELCDSEVRLFNKFTAKLPLEPDAASEYSGAICTFADFLLPFFDTLRSLGSFPDAPVFLMLDDADNLPLPIQRVINTWISMRTTTRCCLKVTTQLGYGTYRTLDWRLIESPHDFGEVDITSVYTSSQAMFYRRVEQIVSKRLRQAGIEATPDLFFPLDEAQQARLLQIQERIRDEWRQRRTSEPTDGRKGGYRAADDVMRYAVPELMRELASGKSSQTFSYAGFDSLVNLSSGVIRWFLEPAAEMYAEVAASVDANVPVERIPVIVQDRVIRLWSSRFLDDIARLGADHPGSLSEDSSLHARVTPELCRQLRNLLEGLGEFFNRKVLDPTSSERRAFSIVLRGNISAELKEVLDFGVRQGYLQRADNAAKEGASRRYPRYILARRLGPRFYLDISGYAAHLSVTAEDLSVALADPRAFVRRRLDVEGRESQQLSIFDARQEVKRDDEV